jgi:hypothetical protein
MNVLQLLDEFIMASNVAIIGSLLPERKALPIAFAFRRRAQR